MLKGYQVVLARVWPRNVLSRLSKVKKKEKEIKETFFEHSIFQKVYTYYFT